MEIYQVFRIKYDVLIYSNISVVGETKRKLYLRVRIVSA